MCDAVGSDGRRCDLRAHSTYVHATIDRGWVQLWSVPATFTNEDLSEFHGIDSTGGKLS